MRAPLAALTLGLGLLAVTGCSGSRPSALQPACDAAPLRAYAEQRPRIAPQERERFASEAVIASCPHRLMPLQRYLLGANTIQAADARATAFSRLDDDMRRDFWITVCPASFIDRDDRPQSKRLQRLEQWDNCEVAKLSPFEPDELRLDNWYPPMWAVAGQLEQGGIDAALADQIARDLSSMDAGPVDPTLALSATRRPIDLLSEPPQFDDRPIEILGARFEATQRMGEIETEFIRVDPEDRRPFHVRVRTDDELYPEAAIEMFPLSTEGPGVEVHLGARGLTVSGEPRSAAQIVAEVRAGGSQVALRLHAADELRWQEVVTAIDGLMAECGGWLPFFEADLEELGESCPFSRLELSVEPTRWARLRMVSSGWDGEATAEQLDALRQRTEGARPAIEACMRDSASLRHSPRHEILLTFTLGPRDRLGTALLVIDEPGDRRLDRLEGEHDVRDCIEEALGLPHQFFREGVRYLASATLTATLPPLEP